MSLDANKLVKAVKQAAMEAFMASDPSDVRFGEVVSEKPLNIQLDQKLTVFASQLILTDNVRDLEIEMSSGGGRSTIKLHRALKLGELVVLLRCAGGQKYIVLNRVEVAE